MRSPWVVGGALLVTGLALCILSFVPVTHLEPYTREIQQQIEKVQEDGTVTAWYTFYSNSFTLAAGDSVLIRAQAQDGSLSGAVTSVLGNNVVGEQDDVTNIELEVTIPYNGMYTVTVSRYRANPYVLFLTQATAYVYVKTNITQVTLVQDYRNVATCPYRDVWPLGTTIMILGIGACLVVFAKNRNTKRTL